jgi:hypothetical protein
MTLTRLSVLNVREQQGSTPSFDFMENTRTVLTNYSIFKPSEFMILTSVRNLE